MTPPGAGVHDVLVVGGGPAGSAAAYWLAREGWDVVVAERKVFPREKSCGDGLTPRAVRQLRDMGLEESLAPFHRYDGLRAIAHNRVLEMNWPEHPIFPSYGYVVRRRDLDTIVANNAVSAGATLLTGAEAVDPLLHDGIVCGATVRNKEGGQISELRARYVVVADGSNSRFGRSLGASRDRSYPFGMAIRGYWESPLSHDPWIESALDLRDRQGNSLPGYGWIFPLGDGQVNVGVGLLSTFRNFRNTNTSHLMNEWAATAPDHWELGPEPVAPPIGGKLPMAGSVNPKVGPTWIVVGDASGAVNPFNGEGIDYAYETGRMAASLLNEALHTGDGTALRRYPDLLESEYGLYFKVARLFVKIIGNPTLMREMTRIGMHSRTLMEWVLAIMANLLREDELGPAEAVYRTVAAMVSRVPDRFVA